MNTELHQCVSAIEREIVTLKEIEALTLVIMEKCEEEADDGKNMWFTHEWNRCLNDLFYLLSNMVSDAEERLTAIVDEATIKESAGNE